MCLRKFRLQALHGQSWLMVSTEMTDTILYACSCKDSSEFVPQLVALQFMLLTQVDIPSLTCSFFFSNMSMPLSAAVS